MNLIYATKEWLGALWPRWWCSALRDEPVGDAAAAGSATATVCGMHSTSSLVFSSFFMYVVVVIAAALRI